MLSEQQIRAKIDKQWDAKGRNMDWLGLETVLVQILQSTEISDANKVGMSREAIDAWTKRGHFTSKEYHGGRP